MNFFKSGIFKSVSSTNSTAQRSQAQSIYALAEAERRRAATLREDFTSQPLHAWDTEHVCEFLSSNGFSKYCEIARKNGLTGRLLKRLHRVGNWEDPNDGFGEMASEDISRIVEQFEKREAQVIVRVYDVTGGLGVKGKTALMLVNKIFRSSLGGAYHCGIEVYGLEWAFGDAGIYCTSPRHEVMGHHFREVCVLPCVTEGILIASDASADPPKPGIVYDRCKLKPNEVRKLAKSMKPLWPGSRYDLIHCNCCHFADAFAQALGVGPLPAWINRVARIGAGADIAYLTSGAPSLPREMRGTKEDQQAREMIDSANRLLNDGLITREEYRNLREKHKRFVQEATGPCEVAQIQKHPASALSEATREAQTLLKDRVISEEEFNLILQAHEVAKQKCKSSDESKEDSTKKVKKSGRPRALTKKEKLLGVSEDAITHASATGAGKNTAAMKTNEVLQIEL